MTAPADPADLVGTRVVATAEDGTEALRGTAIAYTPPIGAEVRIVPDGAAADHPGLPWPAARVAPESDPPAGAVDVMATVSGITAVRGRAALDALHAAGYDLVRRPARPAKPAKAPK